MMTWWQINFQDAGSPVMEELIFFHDFTMTILIFILSAVFLMMIFMILNTNLSLNFSENQILETLWTLLPGVILIQLAIPSLSLLYMLEEDSEFSVSIKALGHQWYWSYEISEFLSNIKFDSYMLPDCWGGVRLMDVDNRLVVPYLTPIRLLISSMDVLHSWTVPSLGVKSDACPGRINQSQFFAHRPGVFFGQCSEICGANHSFMPIVLEIVSLTDFIKWSLVY